MITGSVTYDAATVRKMEKVRFRTFNFLTSAARILCGVVMVVSGCFIGGGTGTLLVAFGCFMTVSNDITGRWRADQTAKTLQGSSITVRYEFYEDSFLSITDKPIRCAYEDLILLMEDSQYYYLYPNEYQVYLVSAESVKSSDRESLKRLLAGKTGLTWVRPLSLISANLKTIIQFQKVVSAGRRIEKEKTKKVP